MTKAQFKVDRNICKYYADRLYHLNKLSDDEKQSYIFQTFLSFQKDGWRVALSPSVCRYCEAMVSLCETESLVLILKTLSKCWSGVIESKFCHHILHKTLIRCQEIDCSEEPLVADFINEFLEHVLNNIDRYIEHAFANHTLRLFIQLVAGVQLKKDKLTNTYLAGESTVCQPFILDYENLLNNLLKKFVISDNFSIYVRNELISPLIQVLLIVCHIRKLSLMKETLKNMLKNGIFQRKSENVLPVAFTDPILVYFSDVIIQLLPGKQFSRFLASFLLTSMELGDMTGPISTTAVMAAHSEANKVLRAVFRRLVKLTDADVVLDSLHSTSADVNCVYGLHGAFISKLHGVLCDLASMCLRLNSKDLQKKFFQMLLATLGLSTKHKERKSDRLIIALVTLASADGPCRREGESDAGISDTGDVDNTTSQLVGTCQQPVSLPGCLLTQSLLRFTSTSQLASSICSQPADRLVAWAQHPMLSHVLEVLLQSTSVSGERKLALFTKLRSALPQMSCNRSACRVVEALWAAADQMPQSSDIWHTMAGDLVAIRQRLSTHAYGHFIHQRLQLELFAGNPDLWKRRLLQAHGKWSVQENRPTEEAIGQPVKKKKKGQTN